MGPSFSLETGSQLQPEHPPRPMEAGIDGARRELQDPGDLFIGHSLDVPERQDDPVFLGQTLDQSLDEEPPRLGLLLALGPLSLFPVREGQLADVIQRDFLGPPFLPEKVLDMVHGDPVQPGPEFRLPVEPGQGQIGLQEDLLGQIVGRFPVAGEAQSHAEHLRLVLLDQLFESLGASLLSQPDQLFLFHTELLTRPPHPIRRGEGGFLPGAEA
jgi:hypothetical protein